jgi:hypothetical protein
MQDEAIVAARTAHPGSRLSLPTLDRLLVPGMIHSRTADPISADVSAVYEVPELTDRSAEGFPGPVLIDTPHRPPWQGCEAADA